MDKQGFDARVEVPLTFLGRLIIARYPYAQPGEIISDFQVTRRAPLQLQAPPQGAAPIAGEVLLAAYSHAEERPFEIHDLVIDTTPAADDAGTPAIADPGFAQLLYQNGVNTLDQYVLLVTVQDEDRGGQKFLRNNPTRVSIVFNPETGTWQLREPYTIQAGQGITIEVIPEGLGAYILTRSTGNIEDPFINLTVSLTRTAITLRGQLIELGPTV